MVMSVLPRQSEEALLAAKDLKVFAEYCFGFKNTWFHNEWYDTIQNLDIKSGLIIAPRNSAKSTCWPKVGALWLLGRNPDLRIVLVSRTSTLAKTNMRFLRLNIESNDKVREVFPSREIGGRVFGLEASSPWGEDQLTVKNNRHDGVPSVYAVGLEGSISGIRADIIIVDDLIDQNNVMTDSQREKVSAFWDTVIIPTLNPDGRILCVGTRYHAKDFYSRLLDDPMYREHVWVFPALKLDERGELVSGEDGKPISYWPDRWSVDSLLEMKERMGTLAFNSQYMCDVSGYAGTLFSIDDLHFYDPQKDLTAYWNDLDFVVSVDPNITDSPDSDNTAIVTAAVDHKRGTVYVLDIYAKPHNFVDQVRLIKRYGQATRIRVGDFKPESEVKISKIGVESVGYQRSLQQTGYMQGLPVVEIKQGNRDKNIRILGLQPHFENGRLRFPDPDKCKTDWWDGFFEEYTTFPKGRRDDRLDSLEILVNMVSASFGVSGVPWGPADTVQLRSLVTIGRGNRWI